MLGLYIHIPFCISKCSYCDFLSNAPHPGEIELYIEALLSEIAMLPRPGETLHTIFIGGGTPSVCPPGAIARVMDAVARRYSIDKGAEITIECNPGAVSREKLSEYISGGINRLSVGAQSLDDGELLAIGRIHTPAQFFATIEDARRTGFGNVNADLMAGLTGQTCTSLLRTLKEATQLDLQHISLYSLILEPGTPLYSDVSGGKTQLPDEDELADWLEESYGLLSASGYSRYEISNFAKPNRECRHNLNYWHCGEYLAAGLGASSALFDGACLVRSANPSAMIDYMSAISSGNLPAETVELVDKSGQIFEYAMLGLRLTAGLSLSDFKARFGIGLAEIYPRAIQKNTASGLLEFTQTHMRLTPRGLSLQNAVLLDFMDGNAPG